MDNRSIPEVVAVILVILLDTKHRGTPSVPRICIIGPPGSGRKVVAKTIAAKFNLVHGTYIPMCILGSCGEILLYFVILVEFDDLLQRTLVLRDPYFEELRYPSYRDPSKISRLYSEILFKELLDKRCVEYGWILTSYPTTVLDMKRLDKMATPPNRLTIR